MLAAAFVILMFFGGLVLAGMISPLSTVGIEPYWRYVGWGLVVLAVLKWKTVLDGVRQSGKMLAFLLVVAALAMVFSGEGGLWSMFF